MGKPARTLKYALARVAQVFGARAVGKEAPPIDLAPYFKMGPLINEMEQACLEEQHVDHVRRECPSAPLPPAIQANVNFAREQNVCSPIPVFGCRRFCNFEDFFEAFERYCAAYFVAYQRVQATLSTTVNAKKQETYDKQIALGKTPKVPNFIPAFLSHAVVIFVCLHGHWQPSRSSGERTHKSRYIGCPAEITAYAKYDKDKKRWYVETKNENRLHNHELDVELYSGYITSSKIEDQVLRDKVEAMAAAHGKSHVMLNFINRYIPFTPRQLENFLTYRLGPGAAVEGLKGLLHKFVEIDGNQLLIVHDQDGITCGIAVQTSIQRQLFAEYGDNMILDWTHKTNSLGFYLGSFLVTTASGKGVSVFDFLSLTQSKDMMRRFFTHFGEMNAGALDLIKSFLIDKDYLKWAILKEVFHKSQVVLCQFHVKKWFRYVVTQPKYNISGALRVEVLECLNIMIYASSELDFRHQQQLLEGYLSSDDHKLFLEYMNVRWYNCIEMWANHRRGLIFTATNTTSNRLESFWRRLKEFIEKHRRIDQCVSAIFQHATSVLRREKDALVDYISKYSRRMKVAFLDPILRDMGEYTAKLVRRQWALYSGALPGSYQLVHSPASDRCAREFVVRVMRARQVDFVVNADTWTCTCQFFSGSWLPCRHIMYVAQKCCDLPALPLAALAPRWSLRRAASKFTWQVAQAVDTLSTPRVDLIKNPTKCASDVKISALAPSDMTTTHGDRIVDFAVGHLEKASPSAFAAPETPNPPIKLVALPQHEVNNYVILDDDDKRRVVSGQFEALRDFMAAQGTPRFWECAKELEDVLQPLLKKWKSPAHHEDPSAAEGVLLTHGEKTVAGGKTSMKAGKKLSCRPGRKTVNTSADAAAINLANITRVGDHLAAEDIEARAAQAGSGLANVPTGPTASTPSVSTAAVDAMLNVVQKAADPEYLPDDFGDWRETVGDDDDEYLMEEDIPQSPEPQSPERCTQVSSSLDELLQDDGDSDPDTVLGPIATRSDSFDRWIAGADWGVPADASPVQDEGATRAVKRQLDHPSPSVEESNKRVVQDEGATRAVKRQLDHPSPSVEESNNRVSRSVIDSMSLPRQLSAGNVKTAKSVRSASQSKSSKPARPISPASISMCPVIAAQFVKVLQYLPLSEALALAPNYPFDFTDSFVELRDLTIVELPPYNERTPLACFVSTQALCKLLAMDVGAALPLIVDMSPSGAKSQASWAVSFAKGTHCFTREDIQTLNDFDYAKKELERYALDMQRLDTDAFWGGIVSTSRSAVKNTLKTCSRHTILSLPAQQHTLGLVEEPVQTARIRLGEVMGRLGRSEWINDSVLNFALHMLANRMPGVVVIGSLNANKIVVPSQRLRSTQLVIFPLNIENKHWGIVCARLNWSTGEHIAVAYNSSFAAEYREKMMASWKEWCEPLLLAWGDIAGSGRLRFRFETVSSSVQEDSNSCGVHAFLFARRCLTGEPHPPPGTRLSSCEVSLARLHIMHIILCCSHRSLDYSAAKSFGDFIQEKTKATGNKTTKK